MSGPSLPEGGQPPVKRGEGGRRMGTQVVRSFPPPLCPADRPQEGARNQQAHRQHVALSVSVAKLHKHSQPADGKLRWGWLL